jgi:3-hydroxyisobutyrate dehydrogenase-like beta-hydroxyacid dehydrogenase
MTALALIGFGEVGRAFAKGFQANSDVRVSAYDILFDQPHSALRDTAGAVGARIARNAAEACRDARVIISAVTASATFTVAEQAAAYLKPGQLYLDVNSASPETKRKAAHFVQGAGADYVEGAVMAAVGGPGLKVPMLAGGPAAQSAAELLNGLGMNLTPFATEYGRASATKLSRSIVMKGLEAILLECSAAARHWGVETDVIASLQATYPGMDWAKLVTHCGERVATHGMRRSQEMGEAADMLEEMGHDPALCRAISKFQARNAKR